MSSTKKPKRRSRGAPTLCTPELTAEFARYMAASPYIEPACGMVGIAPLTAYKWLDRGQAELERLANGEKPIEAEAPYLEFTKTVARARAALEMRLSGEVIRASGPHHTPRDKDGAKYEERGDATLALSVLKCAFPDRWGARELKVKSEVKVSREPVDLSILTDEELEVYHAAMARMAGPMDEEG